MSNWTTVSATSIKNLNNTTLASGTLVFQATDANNVPVSFQVGGGGHILRTPFSSAITNGAVTSFSVPDPADTNPAGIFYRVTVISAQGIVLEYRLVSFTGTNFNLDNYAPSGAAVVPPTGGSINGNLSVNGNLTVTGTITSFDTGNFAYAEVPSGTIDGVNTTFTYANSPNPPSSLTHFLNGFLLIAGVDYILSGATLTYVTPPQIGDSHVGFYRTTGSSTGFGDAEVPVGTINGVNVTFTYAHSPNPSASLEHFMNGNLLTEGSDYTLSGAVITYANPPQAGDSHIGFYRY